MEVLWTRDDLENAKSKEMRGREKQVIQMSFFFLATDIIIYAFSKIHHIFLIKDELHIFLKRLFRVGTCHFQKEQVMGKAKDTIDT